MEVIIKVFNEEDIATAIDDANNARVISESPPESPGSYTQMASSSLTLGLDDHNRSDRA